MTAKLLLCFFSVVAGTMTGFYFFKREDNKEKYFASLVSLCNHLITDISFSKTTMAQLLLGFMSAGSSPLENNLNEYLAYIDGQKPALCLSKGTLKPLEHAEVTSFFDSLGRLDSQTQLLQIQNYRQKFEELRQAKQQKNQKQAKNYVKLGFLLGLAIGILIM